MANRMKCVMIVLAVSGVGAGCSSSGAPQSSRLSTILTSALHGSWSPTDTAACSTVLTNRYSACVFDGTEAIATSARIACEPDTSLAAWKARMLTPSKGTATFVYKDLAGIGDAAVLRSDRGKPEGVYSFIRGHRCSVHIDPVGPTADALVTAARAVFAADFR